MANKYDENPDLLAEEFDQLEMEFNALSQSNDKLGAVWKELDFNGNGKVSLAEIDKWVTSKHEKLNNKPALMRAYKRTTGRAGGGDGDAWVEKKELRILLPNLVRFNKLYAVFEDVDSGDDRRVDINEFKSSINRLGMCLSDEQAEEEFKDADENGGGQMLFDEFCAWFLKQQVQSGMLALNISGFVQQMDQIDDTAQKVKQSDFMAGLVEFGLSKKEAVKLYNQFKNKMNFKDVERKLVDYNQFVAEYVRMSLWKIAKDFEVNFKEIAGEDGKIQKGEMLSRLVDTLGLDSANMLLNQLWNEMDVNDDGAVELKEIQACYQNWAEKVNAMHKEARACTDDQLEEMHKNRKLVPRKG